MRTTLKSYRALIPTALAAALLLSATVARGQRSHPRPPDHYSVMSTWVEGEIVDVGRGGRELLVRPVRILSELTGDSRELLFERRPLRLDLSYARGWAYFDAPDGGDQERLVLREGRDRFRAGQMIEVGRASRFRGGAEYRSVQASTQGAFGLVESEVSFQGYIMVRITPFREDW